MSLSEGKPHLFRPVYHAHGALLFLPALAFGWLIYPADHALAIIVVVCYVAILAAITSAVKGVFTVALYRYASQGEAPPGSSAALIDETLGARKSSNDWSGGL